MTLPDPRAIPGVVAVDQAERVVTVMPAEPGYASLLWRRGYDKLARDERNPRVSTARPVYAHGAGGSDISRGQPVGGALQFKFHPGEAAFSKLVGTPRLSAIITVDQRSGDIMGVGFRSGPREG